MVNSRPRAIACCRKIASAISSPSSPYVRTCLAATPIGTSPSGWPLYLVSQYGSRLFWMPVSEATLSASPDWPQLHAGIGWPSSSSPSSGMGTWPSSPAIPAAPLTTCPVSMIPPPRPVPTIAATELRCPDSAPNRTLCAYSAAAFPSLL